MRLAFIGGWGHQMLKPLATGPDARAAAVAVAGDGQDNDAARQRLTAFPQAAWFDDARQMLETFKPDLVNVGAVYAHNGDWVIECIRRGIPVVSDKPIATTWPQYEAIQQAVAQHPGAKVITELPYRSSPAVRAARDAIAAGRIGPVVLATGQKSYRFGTRPPWYADRSQYGGTILWVASHAIDFIRFATGLPYTRVLFGGHNNLTKPQYGSMEEATVNVLELQGGAQAIVHADYCRPKAAPTHGDDRLRIVGGSGQVEVRDERCVLIAHDQPPTDITDQARVKPACEELLAAALGQDDSIYGTPASLEIAKVLLHCRDAADQHRPVIW